MAFQLMENDHAELRSLADDILHSAAGPDAGGRDNQFDLYDIQLRRHLAVMEDVLLPACRGHDEDRTYGNAIEELHGRIRKELKQLDRRDKESHGWAAEFRNLTQDVETSFEHHQKLMDHCRSGHPDEFSSLSGRYEKAKLRRMRGWFDWNRVPSMPSVPGGTVGTAAAAAGAAAALAGAGYAASRWFRSGRRASGRREEDFELRLETDENMRLISSTKVEGTPVYDRDGKKIGAIENFMVDKYTGRVAYSVMSFGGHFGFGEQLFPLPWAVLDYDEELDGFHLDITKEELKNAPSFEKTKEPDWSPRYRREILIFYRPPRARFLGEGGIAEGGESEAGESAFGNGGINREEERSDARQSEPTGA